MVDIRIDEERRLDISQQHTAQHLLSAVFLSEMDAETVGFQMGEGVHDYRSHLEFLRMI